MTTHLEKHTSGPWRVGKYNGQPLGIYDKAGNCLLATLPEWRGEAIDEADANADLLASAPELLIAAKNAANVLAALATGQLATVKSDSHALQMLRDAIANAERGEA